MSNACPRNRSPFTLMIYLQELYVPFPSVYIPSTSVLPSKVSQLAREAACGEPSKIPRSRQQLTWLHSWTWKPPPLLTLLLHHTTREPNA